MKNRLFIGSVIFLLLAVLPVAAKSKEEKGLAALSVKENVFVDESGRVVRLAGVSFSDPDKLEKEGHWNFKYFKEAKKWGCNVVRFPVHPYTWRYRGAEAYMQLLDKGVKWAEKAGLYVIVDWHSIGNLPGNKYPHFNYATNWDETVKFWKLMAERYRNNSVVACYELFNEPIEEEHSLNWKVWRPMMEKLIDEIRKIDNRKICLVAGMNWAYLLDEVIENPVNRSNVAYVTHPYPQKREQPWEDKWDADWGKVTEYYPIIATELGFVGAGERGEHIPVIGDETYGKAIIDYFDKKGVSYTIWCFDPDWAPTLIKDYKFTPSRQGVFFKKVLQKNK